MGKYKYSGNNRHASWLELFFDLIFVVALGKVTHLLAYTHQQQLEADAFPRFFILFIPFWWIWVLHTSFSNRFDSDNRFHRILTLLLMFVLIILSTTLDSGEIESYRFFLLVFVVAKLIIVALYINALRIKQRSINRNIVWAMSCGTLLAMAGIWLNYTMAAVLLLASILLEILWMQWTLHSDEPTRSVDKEHLVERIGLLALIFLGESIISLVSGLTSVSWTWMAIATGVTGFAIIAMIWWIYFDSLGFLIESKKDKNGTGIVYSHLLVYMSFSILANTIRHAILQDLNLTQFRVMAITGMLLLYIGKQTAYAINVPKHNMNRVKNSAIALSVAVASLLLSEDRYILFGMALSFAVYIIANYRMQMKFYGKVNF